MSTHPVIRTAALVALLAACPTRDAAAIDSTEERRVLAGHPFIPVTSFEQPFLTRRYSMQTGLGLSLADIPGRSETFRLVSFGFGFDTQQPLWRMLALRVAAGGSVILGAGIDEALDFGATGLYRAGGGLVVNAFQNDRFSLTLALDVSGGQDFSVTPRPAIEASIQAREVSTDGLFAKTTSLDVIPELTAAVGLFKAMGLFALFGYDFERSHTDGFDPESGHYLQFGAGLSTNFAPYEVPLGVTASYKRSQPVGGAALGLHQVQFGLHVSHEHFAFGLEAIGRFVKTDENVTINTWLAMLSMHYIH